MAFDFSGKKVLVTGAGRGIGRGIALALAKAGCKVYALDCNKERLDTLTAEHSSIVAIVQDLTNWDETKTTLEGVEALDGLANVAGVFAGFGPSLEVSKQDIDTNLSVNLFATINCIQEIGKTMVASGKSGSIVNISSICGQLTSAGTLGYSLSKAGVDMVTKQFALELGPHNIRVNSVNPTVVDTELLAPQAKATSLTLFSERQPLSRMCAVQEVVGPVMYLLSDYSAMVTGTTHLIDGGMACNITTKT